MLEISEAKRCLNCKKPKCREGCPIHNRIPEFIAKIKEGNYEEAYRIIRSVSPLGAICGRVCPHEKQCQGSCVRGIKTEPIQIGKLEAAVCDWARENNVKIKYAIKENGMKIAIVGSGPAGIACAVELRKLGYDVTMFEKENYLGGILMYGIPEYRLPKEIVRDTINDLLEMGIKVKLNTILMKADSKNLNNTVSDNFLKQDKNGILNEERKDTSGIAEKTIISIQSLFKEGYKAIFLAIGTEISNVLPIDGNQNLGVIGANEFLKGERKCNGKKVIVIGGGNVAMDAARVANKEGADVTVIYRKQKENMPANKNEIEEAEKEGVKFIFGTNILKINVCDKEVENKLKVECDTGKEIETNYLIMAIGSQPNLDYIDKNLKLTEQGLLAINENYETSIENVFAGGDLVQKKATVCMAIKNGKDAAEAIDSKLKNT